MKGCPRLVNEARKDQHVEDWVIDAIERKIQLLRQVEPKEGMSGADAASPGRSSCGGGSLLSRPAYRNHQGGFPTPEEDIADGKWAWLRMPRPGGRGESGDSCPIARRYPRERRCRPEPGRQPVLPPSTAAVAGAVAGSAHMPIGRSERRTGQHGARYQAVVRSGGGGSGSSRTRA